MSGTYTTLFPCGSPPAKISPRQDPIDRNTFDTGRYWFYIIEINNLHVHLRNEFSCFHLDLLCNLSFIYLPFSSLILIFIYKKIKCCITNPTIVTTIATVPAIVATLTSTFLNDRLRYDISVVLSSIDFSIPSSFAFTYPLNSPSLAFHDFMVFLSSMRPAYIFQGTHNRSIHSHLFLAKVPMN